MRMKSRSIMGAFKATKQSAHPGDAEKKRKVGKTKGLNDLLKDLDADNILQGKRKRGGSNTADRSSTLDTDADSDYAPSVKQPPKQVSEKRGRGRPRKNAAPAAGTRKQQEATAAPPAPPAAPPSAAAPLRMAAGERCSTCARAKKGHCGTKWSIGSCEQRNVTNPGFPAPGEVNPNKGFRNSGRPRITASKAATSAKGGRGNISRSTKPTAAAPKAPAARRQYFPTVQVEGDVYKVGDSVYMLGPNVPDELEEDSELCVVCDQDADVDTMLECDLCLRGFHLGCLKPPLKSVPEGDWVCDECAEHLNSGGDPEAVPKAGSCKTAREMYLSNTQQLHLARIERIWREKGSRGEYMVTTRWYLLPEETHTGRQRHHGRREVFLSSLVDDNPAGSVYRAATVCRPAEFARSGDGGDDVYLCEYLYDATWQRFRRIGDADEAGAFSTEAEFAEVWNADEADGREDEEDEAEWDAAEEVRASKGEGRAPAKKRRQSLAQAGKAQLGAMLGHVKRLCMFSDGGDGATGKKGAANVRHKQDEFAPFGDARNVRSMGLAAVPERRKGAAPKGPLAQARAALTLAATPKTLPCRDPERAKIRSFLQGAIVSDAASAGRCLYMYGVPGTGKTATVLEVVRHLYEEVHDGALPNFQFVEINGLRLPSPAHAYTTLWEALTGRHASPNRAAELLEEYFTSKAARPVTVLLVDELDLLVTRNQSVLYNLFDWPSRPHSQLAVVGIANTMDLPERMLPRINSRLGLSRVAFQPYTQEQLQAIVRARLQGLEAFKDKAIELAARKVAAVSGDVRRTLELCRRAAELAEERWRAGGGVAAEGTAAPDEQQVRMEDIGAAVKELFGEPHMQIWKACAPHAKVVLCALLCETRRSGLAECRLDDLYGRYTELCRMHAMAPTPWAAVAHAVAALGESRMLLVEPGARGATQKIALNWSQDSLEYSLKTQASDVPWMGAFITRLTAVSQ